MTLPATSIVTKMDTLLTLSNQILLSQIQQEGSSAWEDLQSKLIRYLKMISHSETGMTLSSAFSGIINTVTYFEEQLITLADTQTYASTTCQWQCNVCKISGASPYGCFTYGNIAFYDFQQSTYPSSLTQADSSGKGYNLDVNTDFDFTPIYAHNMGLYFDPTFALTDQYMNSKAANNWVGNELS